MSKVSVYKASAGAGKTFRLTLEYLKIVLEHPSHYKKILAITFTNKAMVEMKSRILEQLHELATGQNSDYKLILIRELSLSDVEITERAKQAEQYILHDYGRFSVMTIDAFFQSILKAFAKELGIAYNYNIELDIQTIQRLAVERMFSELDENKALRTWLFEYIEAKVKEGKSWNITKDILGLSKELFQEGMQLFDKEKFAKWGDRDFVKAFSVKLATITNEYEKELKELGARAMLLLEKQQLEVEHFSYKNKGVGGMFLKLSEGVVLTEITSAYLHKAVDNPEGWYPKGAKPDVKQRIDAIYLELNEALKTIFRYVEEKSPLYLSCLLVKKNLYMMGIFSDIAKHMYAILNEEDKVLLSESNKLLYEMIANNDVPFIYEKTGNHYLYFLWDEFQDTSQMQWHNLKPLLSNALAEGNPCLIVGDIKQAIYRWRNSDWKILEEEVPSAFPSVDVIAMQQNWRSDAKIIAFNNALYTSLPSVLDQKLGEEEQLLTSLYHDAVQKYARNDSRDNGYVHFSYLESSKEYNDEELVLKQLPEWVEKLQQKGVKPEEIVFLVRKNSQAIAITEFFSNWQERKEGVSYDVMSEQALLLQNAFVVKVLINALSYLYTREKYYEISLGLLAEYITDGKKKEQQWVVWTQEYPTHISLEIAIQTCIRTFALHEIEEEQLYLMAFEEFVNQFIEEKGNSLADFLVCWEDKKSQISVVPGDLLPAMRVMTIHKAKGLEFHTVILPYIEKNIDAIRNDETLWQKADYEPFVGVGEFLVSYNKNLEKSSFQSTFEKEKQQRYIDELNAFYVATTRAVTNLIIIAPSKSYGTRLSTVFYELLVNAEEDSFWRKYWDEAEQQWNYGQLEEVEKEKLAKENRLEQNILYYQDYFTKFPLKTTAVDGSKRMEIEALTPTEGGNIWHTLLEYIHYYDEVEMAVKRAYYEGIITCAAQQNYMTHLKQLLKRETIQHYYTKDYEIWNERPLWIEGRTYIPDRVVRNKKELVIIEYKFGEAHVSAHSTQLKKYINFFQRKGFSNVKGHLIYGVFSEIITLK